MEHKVINSVEALLFGSGRPIRLSEIKSILENTGLSVELSEIKRAINDLEMRYEGTSLKVTEVASGYRLQIKEDHGHILSALWNEKAPRVSKALMETISIIAYKQPVTRGDIEDIRGISVNSNIIRTLLELEWIKVVGHRETPGKPELFATTSKFLDYFDKNTLSDLPEISDVDSL